MIKGGVRFTVIQNKFSESVIAWSLEVTAKSRQRLENSFIVLVVITFSVNRNHHAGPQHALHTMHGYRIAIAIVANINKLLNLILRAGC